MPSELSSDQTKSRRRPILETNMAMDVRLALYARYSDESQSASSIDDQMRRALEVVQRSGLKPKLTLKFSDEDMSGFNKREALARPGFSELMRAWDNDEFDVLAVDEMSRLGRNRRQLLEVLEHLDDTPVRLICGDGIDSNAAGAKLLLAMKSVLAQEESLATAHRVTRGLYGQVTRGYMVAPPPFGYVPEQLFHADGRKLGTVWRIVPEQAEWVREMYRLRSDGMAYNKIAKKLNEAGVPTKRDVVCWRGGTVRRMLANPIYRGEFHWLEEVVNAVSSHVGPTPLRQKCAFERPELRIVSDEAWFAVQAGKVSRSGYGGGRMAYSGVVECGRCHGILTVGSKGKAFACGKCSGASLAGFPDAPDSVPTISVAGLTAVFRYVLKCVLDTARLEALRERLRARLEEGPAAELALLRKRYSALERSAQNLLRLISHAEGPDSLLDAQYKSVRSDLAQVERDLKACERINKAFDAKVIVSQMEVDPSALVNKLLDGKLPAEQLRAVLTQLFPRFAFVGRESRYIALFEIDFAPGAAVAWLTNTKAVLDDTVTLRVKLIGSAKRPVTWEIVEW